MGEPDSNRAKLASLQLAHCTRDQLVGGAAGPKMEASARQRVAEPIESGLWRVAQRGAVTSRNAPVQRIRAGTKGRRLTCGVGPTLSTITAAEDPVQALVVHTWLRVAVEPRSGHNTPRPPPSSKGVVLNTPLVCWSPHAPSGLQQHLPEITVRVYSSHDARRGL